MDALDDLKMAYPKSTPKRRRQLQAIRKRLAEVRLDKLSEVNRVIGAELDTLQRESFSYFEHEVNSVNGLVIDKTAPIPLPVLRPPASRWRPIRSRVERGFISRAAAVERTLTTLRFFSNSPQGPEPDATGYQGFYYHFLDMQTGRRAWQCELSTVDTAFLLAGMLTAAAYFDAHTRR